MGGMQGRGFSSHAGGYRWVGGLYGSAARTGRLPGLDDWGGGRVTVSRLIYNNYEQFNTFFLCSITMAHAFEEVVCVSKFCTVVRF